MPSRAAGKKPTKTARRGAAKRTARKAASKRAPRKSSDYVVFISHSSMEIWIAGQLAKEVKAKGAKPWVDVGDISGGDDFYNRIMKAIHDCTEAIVLISPVSSKSQWVSFEIGAVAGQGKRVTPVLNNVPASRMEPLRRVNAIDLNDFDTYLKQLVERIRQHRRDRKR
jgi:hypothetical protein